MGTPLLTKQIEKYTNANLPASLWQHLDRQMIISGVEAQNVRKGLSGVHGPLCNPSHLEDKILDGLKILGSNMRSKIALRA